MDNKVNNEETFKIFSAVFSSKDYNDFLSIIKDNEEQIKDIDLSPVKNYQHSDVLIDNNIELLEFLYQHIKYYLEKKNMYEPKIQEGIALCASKAAISAAINPNIIVGYIDLGDKAALGNRCNPFEEISRMLLVTLRENPTLEFFEEHQTDINSSSREVTIFFKTIKTVLNKEMSTKAFEHYAKGDIAELIGKDLERSNISSANPLSATKSENAGLLDTQFDRINELYQTNIELQVVIGNILNENFEERYLTRFQNKLIRAKRNIGVYQKTKNLVK